MKTPKEIIDDHAAVLEACEMRIDAQEIIGALDAAGYAIERKERIADLEKRANGKYAGC